MRNLLITVAVFLFLGGCQPEGQELVVVQNVNNIEQWSTDDQDLYQKLEYYRESIGLPSLEPSKGIQEIATIRLEKIKLKDSISHDGVGEAFLAMRNLGYQYPTEILAYGYTTNESTLRAWINSEGHYKAIIREGHLYIGVHVLKYNGKKYYIALFAR